MARQRFSSIFGKSGEFFAEYVVRVTCINLDGLVANYERTLRCEFGSLARVKFVRGAKNRRLPILQYLVFRCFWALKV